MNKDFLSLMIFERYASSNRSSSTCIRSSVSDHKSDRQLQTIDRRASSAKRPRMVLMLPCNSVCFDVCYHHKSNWGEEIRIKTYSFSGLQIDCKRWTTRQLTHRRCTYRSTCSCPLKILCLNGQFPSFINHRVLPIRNDWPGSLCE